MFSLGENLSIPISQRRELSLKRVSKFALIKQTSTCPQKLPESFPSVIQPLDSMNRIAK